MKKFITVLMSIVMLLTPVLGCAEAVDGGYYYFSISNPYLSSEVGELELDLEGFEMLFAVENTEDAFHALFGMLGNDKMGISGHLTLDESGLLATVDGMENAIGIPMETIELLMTMAEEELTSLAEEMGATFTTDGSTTLFARDLNEEAMADFEEALYVFLAGILTTATEPVADTLTFGDTEEAAQTIEFEISNEVLAPFMKSTGDLLMSDADFAAGYREYFESSGEEYVDLGTAMEQLITECGLYVDGYITMGESGNFIAEIYFNYYDGVGENGEKMYAYIPVEIYCFTDEEGTYFDMCIYPSEEEAVEFYVAISESTDVAGEMVFYADLTAYTIEDGDYETEAVIDLLVAPYVDEDGIVYWCVDMEMSAEDAYANIGAIWYDHEAMHGAEFYVAVESEEGNSEISIGYDGETSADGMTETGVFYTEMYENDACVIEFYCDVEAGQNVSGESIAYDFSGLNVVDILTADEATLSSLGEEALTAVMDGAQIIGSEIPIIGMLLSFMA